MNREQTIRVVADKVGLSGRFTTNLVDAMEAVGVLKLDEERINGMFNWNSPSASGRSPPTWSMRWRRSGC
jgi:hypothetical protein